MSLRKVELVRELFRCACGFKPDQCVDLFKALDVFVYWHNNLAKKNKSLNCKQRKNFLN